MAGLSSVQQLSAALEVESRSCVAWKTERPTSQFRLRSSDFCAHGSEWYLEMHRVPHNDRYQIMLIKVTEERLRIQFRVTTFIEREIIRVMPTPSGFIKKEVNAAMPLLSCSTTVSNSEQCLWSYSSANILQSFPEFHNDEKFKIVCVFEVVPDSRKECRREAEKYLSHLKSLSRDFRNLYVNPQIPDVELRCCGDTIRVHRAVLAARSEEFAGMFQNATVESNTGIVKFPDGYYPFFRPFLKYMYSGEIPTFSVVLASKWYAAGVKYAVHSLKKACAERIVGGLTEDNCLDFLVLADEYDDNNFKDEVINFVAGHLRVLFTDDWSKLKEKHHRLVIHVLENIVFQKCLNVRVSS